MHDIFDATFVSVRPLRRDESPGARGSVGRRSVGVQTIDARTTGFQKLDGYLPPTGTRRRIPVDGNQHVRD
jgi:hypothetical protein